MAERLVEGVKGVKLRNIFAHQYLEKWNSIRDFLSEGWKVYSDWLKLVKKSLGSGNIT
jgi:hypothetical protein